MLQDGVSSTSYTTFLTFDFHGVRILSTFSFSGIHILSVCTITDHVRPHVVPLPCNQCLCFTCLLSPQLSSFCFDEKNHIFVATHSSIIYGTHPLSTVLHHLIRNTPKKWCPRATLNTGTCQVSPLSFSLRDSLLFSPLSFSI